MRNTSSSLLSRFRKTFIVLSLVALLPAGAQASMITTTFASSNQYAGNMFDLTTFGNNLTVTGIDVNLSNPGASALISVYTRVGGYAGFETDSGAWTLKSQNSVASQGTDNATFVDVSDFGLHANTHYGVYVTISDYDGNTFLRYTNGSNTYANADLELKLGIGRGNVDFSGSIYNPRTWNGTIYYDVANVAVPEPATLSLLSGGLLGMAFIRRRRRESQTASV